MDELKKHDDATVERSNTVMLAKNIPIDTTIDLLKDTFGKYGALGRVPSHLMLTTRLFFLQQRQLH